MAALQSQHRWHWYPHFHLHAPHLPRALTWPSVAPVLGQLAVLAAFVVCVVTGYAVAQWTVQSLSPTLSPDFYLGVAGPGVGDAMISTLALFVVLSAVPATFGLTLAFVAALIGVAAPFFRGDERKKGAR